MKNSGLKNAGTIAKKPSCRKFPPNIKALLFLLAFVLPVAFAFTSPVNDSVSCDPPGNVTKTAHTLTTISFSWDAASGADAYIVKYVRQSDSYSSGDITVYGTSHTYTNMQAGTYDFYFSSKCGETVSEAIIIVDTHTG